MKTGWVSWMPADEYGRGLPKFTFEFAGADVAERSLL